MGAFEKMLQSAKKGSRADIERLASLFSPLILRYSTINGRLDIDLRQQLYLEFILALLKFEIRDI